MTTGEMNILIVAEDGPTVAELAKELILDMQAGVSIVSTLEEARAISTDAAFDVIVADENLADGSGISLVGECDTANPAPVVLLADNQYGTEYVLDLIRQGAADVITKPIDMNRLVESVRRVGGHNRTTRTAARRSRRLRKMTSRLVRDRRELRQRVDLICRDLVSAYQRLAEKVVDVRQSVGDAESN